VAEANFLHVEQTQQGRTVLSPQERLALPDPSVHPRLGCQPAALARKRMKSFSRMVRTSSGHPTMAHKH